MSYQVVGKSLTRVDAVAKVTGKAQYTADLATRGMLVGKVLRSPYAHAVVKHVDTARAKELPGVEAVLTHQDVPKYKFGTAGHPYALDPAHRDVEDRLILTAKARFVGDAVAAVVAVDELTALEALKLIAVEYEVLQPLLTPEAAMQPGAPLIHEGCANNIVSNSLGYRIGDLEAAFQSSAYIFEDEFATGIVQHCNLENQTASAYVDGEGRIVIISSTQIPHICRRIVGQALGLPWGRIRVIKPYVGGGFGSKQDVCLEPLAAALTLAAGGRPVMLEYSREEAMIDTRTRHAFKMKIKTGVAKDGKIMARQLAVISNTGAYASHGHDVALNGGAKFKDLYTAEAYQYDPVTVYTNLPVAGAMRGYGVPQVKFALECHMDDIARKLNLDPLEFRKQNLLDVGYLDTLTGNKVYSCGLKECIEQGQELIKWDKKKGEYKNQTGSRRKGLGMACFSFSAGVHPISLEIAGARLVLNQDGSVQLQLGATEIGQGSDTVFAQMVAESLGIPVEMVHVISTQDTDISPFDTGAYASRQTYITGMAVKKAAQDMKEKILEHVRGMTDLAPEMLEIKEANIVYKHSGQVVMPLAQAALHSYYDKVFAKPITSDITNNARLNSFSFGATFAEVEVDLKTGRIDILEIFNIHDAGKIINPLLAEAQVHGGVSMGIGYALAEQLLFDPATGAPLNNNFLDYKLPTIMDVPQVGVAFVEAIDPTGPYGNKSLGEPPAISPAPAIRNAVLDATGVAINKLPMSPQKVFEQLRAAGLV